MENVIVKNQRIFLADYGIHPEKDVTLELFELFQRFPSNTTFVFENGDYYFTPHKELYAEYRLSNSDVMPYRVLGIWMKHMENCTLQGNGARLFFSGQMQPFTLDQCSNINIQDFVIDWKAPLVAEGIVVSHDKESVDLYIDPVLFPHRHEENWLQFYVGADEWYPLIHDSCIQFNESNRCVRRTSGDTFIPSKIDALGNHIYRITSMNPVQTSEGNIFVLRHNARIHAGIFTEKCNDITLEDITVHSCGGLGCLAQFCNNLTYRRIHFIPNTTIGRKVVSGRDDGMHITCCSGIVTITECTFLGLMDDPINIHGCCVTSNEVVDQQTLRCKYRHYQACGFPYWAESGNEIAFIERKQMSLIGTARVVSYELEDMETFRLTFASPLPEEVLALAQEGECLALDNLTHTAAFVCTKNRFGSCRARGLLVSTPKPVIIAQNYFASSGSAILLAGDSNEWFESGECNDVEIRDNIFTDECLSSMYQFCHGVISLCPVVPKPDTTKPYHKNIRIVNNIFDCVGTPVLYAFSTGGLTFSKNRIFQSLGSDKWHPSNWQIKLSYCSDVTLTENEWIGKFHDKERVMVECCDNVIV